MTVFCHFPLGGGARGRYKTSVPRQGLTAFQPSSLTDSIPASRNSRLSNQNGPMKRANAAPGLITNAKDRADG